MGLNGYKKLLQDRQELLKTFPNRLEEIASKHGERILKCPSNTISFGITLDNLVRTMDEGEDEQAYLDSVGTDISSLGAMLFSRCVSGTRVIPRGVVKTMAGQQFRGFGSSIDEYPHAYMTAACAIGVNKYEVDEFLVRLDRCLTECKRKLVK